MVYQNVLRALLALILLVLASCGSNSRSSGSVETDDEEVSGSKFTPSPTFQSDSESSTKSDGTLNTSAGSESMKDALSQIPAQNENQQAALDSAGANIEEFAKAYQQQMPGAPLAQLRNYILGLQNARTHAASVASALEQAGLAAIAFAFREMSEKLDVLRFYHPGTGDHFFTTSQPEGILASSLYGYRYEGIGFRVKEKENRKFKVGLYRCYVLAAGDHFASVDPNCEGQVVEGRFGFISKKKRANAVGHLGRYYNPVINKHFITISPDEQAIIVTQGWRFEGWLGWTPN